MPFIEALRQLSFSVGKATNMLFVYGSWPLCSFLLFELFHCQFCNISTSIDRSITFTLVVVIIIINAVMCAAFSNMEDLGLTN